MLAFLGPGRRREDFSPGDLPEETCRPAGKVPEFYASPRLSGVLTANAYHGQRPNVPDKDADFFIAKSDTPFYGIKKTVFPG
jgi:hypothetical protein